MNVDEKFMKKALELARKGYGITSPNPMVGAVVVKNGKIISEGYHQGPGKPHAEAEALEKAGKEAYGSTLYVNLEPCCHYGRTPPCVDRIIEAGVKKVVSAMIDPNPLVSGKGFKKLIEHGIAVECGVLEKEAKKLNEVFIKYITTGKPFIICKYAMTLDGKIAAKTGDAKWISGVLSRKFVHQLRYGVDAILTGIGTVIADDPLLNCRLNDKIEKQPIRIILDSNLRIPLNSKLLHDKGSKTIIVTTEKYNYSKAEKLKALGIEIIFSPLRDNRVDVKWLIKYLGEREITSILVEGGSSVITSFVELGLIDKFVVFVAPKIVGGVDAPTPVAGVGIERMEGAVLLRDIEVSKIGDDVMITAYMMNQNNK
ncbi:MAG TPA: bifunctional diaminohydroxyphosphoribosylaminopyrimidine deaminase/5-amino-6-(5-phosphoribosylamino)uracil reductase RibD [Peptococcaceae bacterium]|nr:bifunctional diaminohydroxyphosphoribosylaminopyrimidine deaminase/5-amino-6-(5-phosphoribosylamino)uracil reductase RibD [Peptococcaceae bacterium]